MKRMIAALALITAIAAFAQPGPPPPPPDALPQYLNLTADQRTAWDAAHKEFETEMKAAHDRLESKIATVLTPEQKAKFDSFNAAMRFMHEHDRPRPR